MTGKRVVNKKFVDNNLDNFKPIVAKNNNQKVYLGSLEKNTITVGKGSAGSGKTYLAASIAAQKYLKGQVNKIIVMRPIVSMGKSSGAFPGTIEEKMIPWLLPIFNHIKKQIGDKKFESDFGKNILIQPLETVRGASFEAGTAVIVDEAQNCTPDEIRSIVTRLEEGCMLAFCGDDKQKDIRGLSGITYLANLIKQHNIPECGVVEFTPEDSVRSGLTKRFVEIFDKEGAAPQ